MLKELVKIWTLTISILIVGSMVYSLVTADEQNSNNENLKEITDNLLAELSNTIQSASKNNNDKAAIDELISNKNVKSLLGDLGNILNNGNLNINTNDLLNNLNNAANNLENNTDLVNSLVDLTNNLNNNNGASNILNNLNNLNNINNLLNDLSGLTDSSPSNVINQNDLIQNIATLLSGNMPQTIGELRKEIINALLNAFNKLIVDWNLTNQSVADMITNLMANITKSEPVSFSTLNQIIVDLLPLNLTLEVDHVAHLIDDLLQGPMDGNQIDYNTILTNIMNFMQSNETIMGLDAAHLNEYIPNLIANLSQAQTIDQVWETLDAVIALHLNLILNNGTMNFSSTIDVLGNMLIQLLIDSPPVQQILSNPTLMQLLNVFNQTYTLTNDSDLALQAAFNELVNVAYTEIIDQLKLIVENVWPTLYESIKNDTDPKVIIGKSAGAAFDAVEGFLNQFGITLPPKLPCSTPSTVSFTSTTPVTSKTTNPPTPSTTRTTSTTPMTTTTPLLNNFQDIINQILSQLPNIEGEKPNNLQPV